MIATTKEQSQRLIAAGVKEGTSDMYAEYFPGVQAWHLEARDDAEFYKVIREIHKDDKDVQFYPAWSLSALWDILHGLDRTYEIDTKMDSVELMELLVGTIIYRFSGQINRFAAINV